MTSLRKVLTVFFFCSSIAGAQTNVERLANTVDSVSMVSFNNWKMSPDLKNARNLGDDPARPEFDDSKWENLRLNQNVYPDSCWLRKSITLPSTYLGQPISGPMKFLVSVDDYGYVWVNGESKGYFPWDGEFELTKDAKPGQTFLIVIKAINTGGPLRLLRAQLQLEKSSALRQKLQDFGMSLRVGQKLLGFDTYQSNARRKIDPGTDKSKADASEKKRLAALLQEVAAKVDVDALGRGQMERFEKSLSDAKAALQPVREFAKRFTLYFDANAHIDAAWLWRDKETIQVCKNTFSSVFNMMNARPEFTYTQSAAAYYDWMEQLYPEVFKGIQQRVKEGRWEVVGGMWVEPDCNLPSGESWMRHLLYSKRYFRQKLGADVKIGWNPDSFGYNWDMPMFYNNAGIDAFITQKIGWNERDVFPYRVFWWQSPDSSRVLSYFPFDYVNTIDDPYQLVDWMRQFEANTGFTKMMILFGVGDHGGGPSIEMLDRIKRLDSLDIYPTLEYGTTTTYLDWLKKQDLTQVPVWNDELYLEYHQGTYTTQAKMKEYNRKSEVLLTNAEKFSSIASMYGRKYNSQDLETAWRSTLFNQFHDILPGSGIRENYIDATEKYKHVEALGGYELQQSIESLAKNIGTSAIKNGTPVVVMNPLAWKRSDLVSLEVPASDGEDFRIFDNNGKEVAAQSIPKDEHHRTVIFVSHDIPALGYAVYTLKKGKSTLTSGHLKWSKLGIENQSLGVWINSDSGWIDGITLKQPEKNILKGFGNELQILEDKPSAWDAWNIGLTGVKYPSKLRSIEIVEQGPVRTVARITRDYLKPGVTKDFPTEDFPTTFFTQDIMLYDGLDRVDFKTDVDWWEDKTMLKVAFPLNVRDTVATYEIPYGSIQRSTQWRNSWDSAKVEVPGQRWADLSQDDFGVSLLTRSKYGFDIKGSTMRLSLLRSPKWPDPTADRGKHSIEYALYPHAGRLEKAQVTRKGFEYNTPLISVVTDRHKGKLPAQQSFVELQPSNLILTTLKKAEDSDAWIVQWYESAGKRTDARLTLPKMPRRVLMSNALEEDGPTVSYQKNVVTVRTKKSGVMTLKITF
ncbi:MAG TPA: glycoside hydrolase family 38 C-terminal domain-containing protein [Bacteroidota bacterium]|nr:glycoside hydrolase family 38 C-terminal domain-containing protein [Bacteroidota bacterium]